MAIYTELPIYKHGCDLLSLALDVQTQMPRMFKRSLGDRIHEQCMCMLEAMAMANASRGSDRVGHIDTLLTHLRATTAMLRVGHDMRRPGPVISTPLWSRVCSQRGFEQDLSATTAPRNTMTHKVAFIVIFAFIVSPFLLLGLLCGAAYIAFVDGILLAEKIRSAGAK